ncbi:hypothetical protein Aoki45_07710 [Algoriphagus sp. oki45]|nr:hypothetical protein Aoki45_07710 [Algoriphagus sp. oki45]
MALFFIDFNLDFFSLKLQNSRANGLFRVWRKFIFGLLTLVLTTLAYAEWHSVKIFVFQAAVLATMIT